MKDPATMIGVIRACFDGVCQVAFVILAAYSVRSLFHYLEARLTVFGAEPLAPRRCTDCQNAIAAGVTGEDHHG